MGLPDITEQPLHKGPNRRAVGAFDFIASFADATWNASLELLPQCRYGDVGPENTIKVQDHGLGILQLQKLGHAGERIEEVQLGVEVVIMVVVMVVLAFDPLDPKSRRRGMNEGVGLAGGRGRY